MVATQYPAFDPSKQTYLDYLTSLHNQPTEQNMSTFPAETSGYGAAVQPVQQAPIQAPKPTIASPANGIGSAVVANQAAQWLPSAGSTVAPLGAAGEAATTTGAAAAGEAATPALTPGLGLGVWGPAAAAVGGTAAGRAIANRSGPTAQGAWGAANAMNPINQAMELPGAFDPHKKLSFGTQAALAIPTGGASFAFNKFKSGKGEKQLQRDDARENAVKQGWFGSNFQAPLAGDESGLVIDIGKDGGFKYTNAAGQSRSFNNYDENDPLSSQGIGWLRPLGAILGKGDKDMTDSFTAQLYNELTKDGKVTDMASLRKRVVELYNTFKLKPSEVRKVIEAMPWSQADKDASYAAIDNLRPGQAPQLKPGEKVPAAVSAAGNTALSPKDPSNMKPMGTGATNGSPGMRPQPRTSQPLQAARRA